MMRVIKVSLVMLMRQLLDPLNWGMVARGAKPEVRELELYVPLPKYPGRRGIGTESITYSQ